MFQSSKFCSDIVPWHRLGLHVVLVVDRDLLAFEYVLQGLEAASLAKPGTLGKGVLRVGVKGVVGLVSKAGTELDNVALRHVQIELLVEEYLEEQKFV